MTPRLTVSEFIQFLKSQPQDLPVVKRIKEFDFEYQKAFQINHEKQKRTHT